MVSRKTGTAMVDSVIMVPRGGSDYFFGSVYRSKLCLTRQEAACHDGEWLEHARS